MSNRLDKIFETMGRRVQNYASYVLFAALAGVFIFEGFMLLFSWRTIMWQMAAAGAFEATMGILLLRASFMGRDIEHDIERTRGETQAFEELRSRQAERMPPIPFSRLN